jgi:hypothetical protein
MTPRSRLEQERDVERQVASGADDQPQMIVRRLDDAHRGQRAVFLAHLAVHRQALLDRALGEPLP